jgi:enoyl-CoA hydratase
LRQLKLVINKGVEADLYTAQAFELSSAGLGAAISRSGEIADSDCGRGVPAFAENGDLWQRRRALARDFWSEARA